MSHPPRPPPPSPLALTRPQARTLWTVLAAVFVAAVVAAIVAGAAIPPAPRSPSPGLFLIVGAAMVTLDLTMAYVVTAWLRRKASAIAPRDALAATQVIVASAVALGAAMMCSVFYFVAREPLLLLLTLPCAAVLLHWFPSESRWARIAPASAGTARPAGRMMRE